MMPHIPNGLLGDALGARGVERVRLGGGYYGEGRGDGVMVGLGEGTGLGAAQLNACVSPTVTNTVCGSAVTSGEPVCTVRRTCTVLVALAMTTGSTRTTLVLLTASTGPLTTTSVGDASAPVSWYPHACVPDRRTLTGTLLVWVPPTVVTSTVTASGVHRMPG